ncbi:MAG: pyridoxal 5'-phosphate synthase glutaminase subunit PdxT [Dehalococcoidia bacterium]|nr:pyridoxal 5'-phosphate synthase glutaminase subunit PdxT [Dehalococcoidia bacterium]
MTKLTIGVLSLQGAFIEHILMFERIGVRAIEVKLPHQLEQIGGLVIPGGESTTVMKLMDSFNLIAPIKKLAMKGLPVWGTCAGMICLSRGAVNPNGAPMQTLELMDISVKRNAFGRQVDSFETQLPIAGIQGGPFPAVFIRAPLIENAGSGVKVLARLPGGEIVTAVQGKLLATSFHPELTGDDRLHRYFADTAGNKPVACPI